MTPEQFKQSVLEHSDRIHSHAAWLLRDLEEARDVTQEALMKLWINHHKIAPEAARIRPRHQGSPCDFTFNDITHHGATNGS